MATPSVFWNMSGPAVLESEQEYLGRNEEGEVCSTGEGKKKKKRKEKVVAQS